MPRLPQFSVYLLLSGRGEVYAGFTGSLKARVRAHNAPSNTGWIRGRRRHLLAVRHFLDRHTALKLERELKRSRYDKRNWIRAERSRLRRLCRRHGIRHLVSKRVTRIEPPKA